MQRSQLETKQEAIIQTNVESSHLVRHYIIHLGSVGRFWCIYVSHSSRIESWGHDRCMHIIHHISCVCVCKLSGVLFCLEDQVVPLPKKLQKAPHNSTVCERVEHVNFLPRGSTCNTENTSTSTLITSGFIFTIYVWGHWFFAKIEGCGNLTNLCKGMQRAHLVNFNLCGPNLSNNRRDQIIFHQIYTTFQLPHTVLFALSLW